MAVKIRMKMMGRKHRPFFRICAVDSRKPRDGRVLEELGTYDPMVRETDARALLKAERIAYWLGVGAQPSDKVKVLIKKYGADGTHAEQQRAARERLALPQDRARRRRAGVRAAGRPARRRLAAAAAAAERPAKRRTEADERPPAPRSDTIRQRSHDIETAMRAELSDNVMRFDVLTLFPGMFPSYLGQSLLKLAIERGLVEVHLHNIRDWAHDKHHTVDDRPFGGGPGMVLKVEPVVECVEAVRAHGRAMPGTWSCSRRKGAGSTRRWSRSWRPRSG